jgi:ribose 5-phosphate isomerase A
MPTDLRDIESQKRAAAERAVELVASGMLVGLGSGSTARYFVEGVARRVGEGLEIIALATSQETDRLARARGIRLVETIDRQLDISVDGADEIDGRRNLIKGRGGALLREKVVAQASRTFVVIADETKSVPRLGRGPVPVEVVPFLWEVTSRNIARLGGQPSLRPGAHGPFRTDNGNLILDVAFADLLRPEELDRELHRIPGVVEHGLFIGMAAAVIFGGPAGIRIVGSLPAAAAG